MTALTEEKIGELRRLHEASCSSPEHWRRDLSTVVIPSSNEPGFGISNSAFAGTSATADFIIAACRALPALLDAASASLSHRTGADGLEERVRELRDLVREAYEEGRREGEKLARGVLGMPWGASRAAYAVRADDLPEVTNG